MRILGISPLDKDATVSIVEDGKILYAAGEERFSRVKQQDGFPYKALENALEYTNTSLSDIDQVVYAFTDWKDEKKIIDENITAEKQFINDFKSNGLSRLLSEADRRKQIYKEEIHGLKNPNEKMKKGFLYDIFYSQAGTNPLFSRYAAKKGSNNWRNTAVDSLEHWQNDLDTGLKKYGLNEAVSREQLLNRWENLVGDKISKQCNPVELNDGELVIQAKNNIWKQELGQRQEDLLNLLNGRLKSTFVKKIKII